MNRVHLGLGGNLGDRLGALQSALAALRARGLVPQRVSSVYDTEPVGFLEQGNFLNLALAGHWDGTPRELLERCLAVEAELGRVRDFKDGPRTIDIDILLRGEQIVSEAGLEIPHPRLHLRRFVLVPLAEIGPEVIHPVLRRSFADLLAHCPDPSRVRRVAAPEAVDA
ncbi:MAG TPA: 2-amino-4-hydroxy-6-hydroxymethyldihydropteridine diphosphokinase [Candidatus Polarisedimenticolia bacterium]|nr:2-amino-4-hydroxy-6-hydroxymethyldihydropteridine diphosphokinase [Candidatus Polarisedimenticolia bacterium]